MSAMKIKEPGWFFSLLNCLYVRTHDVFFHLPRCLTPTSCSFNNRHGTFFICMYPSNCLFSRNSSYSSNVCVVLSVINPRSSLSHPERQFYRLEGVWLTETGMSLLRSISMSPLHKRRQRRSRLDMLCGDGGHDGIELRDGEGDGDEGKGGWTFCCLVSLSPRGFYRRRMKLLRALSLIEGQICHYPLMGFRIRFGFAN